VEARILTGTEDLEKAAIIVDLGLPEIIDHATPRACGAGEGKDLLYEKSPTATSPAAPAAATPPSPPNLSGAWTTTPKSPPQIRRRPGIHQNGSPSGPSQAR